MNTVIIRIIIFGHKGNEKKRNVQTKTTKKRRYDIYSKRNETIIKKNDLPKRKLKNNKALPSLLTTGLLLEKTAASYSPALHCSTIGAGGLNFSVRNGKRWDPAAITT